jgi:hypothetical protein
MGKKLEGAIKGAMAAVPFSVGYSLADNPGGGLMATALGAGIGATIAAAKAAPSEKENQGGHRALSPNQFGKKR